MRFAESSHRITTGLPGPSPETAAAPVCVLASRDDLARDIGGDPELRLVAEVRALVDPSLDPRPAGPLRVGAPRRVDPQALGPHGDLDLRAGDGPCVGIRHHPCQAESRVRFHDAASGRRVVLHEPAVDRVGDADEVGDEAVDRALVELRRPALLLDAAVLHDDDRVAHRQGLLLVVGHVHERDPDLPLELLELELHLLAQLEVERAERLVEEEHGGMVDEGPRERHALLLAARELPGPAGAVARQPHELQRLADAVALVVLADALLAQPVAHVLGDGHVREQGVVLEHGVDVAAVGRDARDRLAGEVDLARGRLLEARDHPQGRRLAAARWPEERVERPAGDLEVHVVDRDDVPEALGDAADVDVRRVRIRGVRGGVVPEPLGVIAGPATSWSWACS